MRNIKVRMVMGVGDQAHLSVFDEQSRQQILEMRLTHEQLGKLVSGQHQDGLDAKVGRLDRVGWTAHNRTESVHVPKAQTGEDQREIATACAEDKAKELEEQHPGWEWEPRVRDCWNHHNIQQHTAEYTTYACVFDGLEPPEDSEG